MIHYKSAREKGKTDQKVAKIFLAPMDGYTDCAFRQTLIEEATYPIARAFTEFVNVESIIRKIRESKKSLLTIDSQRDEQHKASRATEDHDQRKESRGNPSKISPENTNHTVQTSVQLFGKNPESFYTATMHVLKLGYTDIDINLGCSVHKILKNGEGGALIGQYETVEKIFEMCRKAISDYAKDNDYLVNDFKLTAKTRLGFHEDISTEWFTFLDGLELDFLTVHGRIVSQGFRGSANWEKIGEIAAKISTPVIGNGDVCSIEGVEQMQSQYNLEGIMLGRFAQCLLDYGLSKEEIWRKRLAACVKYLGFHEKFIMPMFKCEEDAVITTRKVLLWFLKGVDNAARWKPDLLKAEYYAECQTLLESFSGKK